MSKSIAEIIEQYAAVSLSNLRGAEVVVEMKGSRPARTILLSIDRAAGFICLYRTGRVPTWYPIDQVESITLAEDEDDLFAVLRAQEPEEVQV